MTRTRIHLLAFSAIVALLAACGGAPDPVETSTVTVNVTGGENGTVAVNGTEYTEPVTVENGTDVTITATPDAGYTVDWSGACAAAGDTTCTLSAVEEDQTVGVAFVEEAGDPTVTVNVTGDGTGTVTVNGTEYTDPVTVEAGSTVTIAATPANADTTVAWTGACEGTEGNECTIRNATTDVTVGVEFDDTTVAPTDPMVNVDITGVGNGIVTVDGTEYTDDFSVAPAEDGSLTLTATANEGFIVEWSGACADVATDGTCALTNITSATDVGVAFVDPDAEPVTYDVTVNVTAGADFGTLMVDGQPYTSGTTLSIEENASVTITADPAEGYTTDWGDTGPCADATGNECVIAAVTADTVVELAFVEDATPAQHDVTYTVTGEANGTVDISVNGTTYTGGSPITVDEGDTVTFTATANAGYDVVWTGACEGNVTGDVCTLSNVTADATVGIDFVEEAAVPGQYGISSRVDGASPSVEITPGTWTADARTEAERFTGLASVIQGIVDQPEWTDGDNAIVLVVERVSSSNANAYRRAYDFRQGQASAPALVINYTVGGVAQPQITEVISMTDDDAEEFVNGASPTSGAPEVYQNPGAVVTNTTVLDFGYDSNFDDYIIAGLRFDDVAIPAGATITDAYVQFTAAVGATTSITLRVSGQLAVNPPTFVDSGSTSGVMMPAHY